MISVIMIMIIMITMNYDYELIISPPQVAMMPDRAMRLLEVKKLLERMPRANHAVLKFIFQHFVRWAC